jgi:hypothetical protein
MQLRKVFSRYELVEGAEIPRGYGLAYVLPREAKSVFYPVPINLIVNLHRKIRELVLFPSSPKLTMLVYSAYLRGRSDGIRLMQDRVTQTLNDLAEERLGGRR